MPSCLALSSLLSKNVTTAVLTVCWKWRFSVDQTYYGYQNISNDNYYITIIATFKYFLYAKQLARCSTYIITFLSSKQPYKLVISIHLTFYKSEKWDSSNCARLVILMVINGRTKQLGEVPLSRMRACVPSCFSCVWLCVTLWTVARQAPLSMGFSRQEHWDGLTRPPPGDLPISGIKPASPRSPALAGDY